MIVKYKSWVLALLLLFYFDSGFAQHKLNTIQIKTSKDLREFFRYTSDRIPLICGHRGGAQSLYPENSIAGLEYILSQMPAFFEIDPRLTKDSVIVVLHDATLDRTTTGTGKLIEYTWEELQNIRLKDRNGKATDYKIRKLDDFLQWSKDKTLLMLDKKDVPLEMLYEAINRNKAFNNVIISTYEPAEAFFYYQRNKDLMFEVFVKNTERLNAFEATGVPLTNMIAYLGQPKKKEFYDLLHQKGLMTMIYTGKFMEKEKNKDIRVESYKNSIKQGGDILLSDRAVEAYQSITEFIPENSSKAKYFNTNQKKK